MSLAAEAWTLAFGGLSVEAGIALREAARARHFESNDPERFQALLSIGDLDRFLATDGAATPRVSMADGSRKGSAAVPDDEYAREDGRIDLPKLLQRFDAGATLVVSQFHEMHEPLARFCRGLERVFLHPVQANIYLTPPGAQGFRVHYDTHDVLVLQVAGEKRWRIWDDTPVPFATRRTPWEKEREIPDEDPKTLTLRAGDVLYVPRGILHDAAAQEADGQPSLHVTVGLLEPSWADALRFLADAIEAEDVELRKPFPVWRLGEPGGIDAMIDATRAKVASLATPRAVELMGLALLDKLAMDRMPMPARGLLAAPPGPADRVRIAETVHHHVVPVAGGAQLRWGGGVIPLTAEELGFLERLDAGVTPAELGGDAALAFCRRLYAMGLLDRA